MAFQTYEKAFPLGTSSAQLSTGLGANETLQITGAYIVNTNGTAQAVWLNLAGDGGVAATGNAVEVGKTVAAGDTRGAALTGMNIIPGAKLYGYAGATGVNLILNGLVTDQTPRVW